MAGGHGCENGQVCWSHAGMIILGDVLPNLPKNPGPLSGVVLLGLFGVHKTGADAVYILLYTRGKCVVAKKR